VYFGTTTVRHVVDGRAFTDSRRQASTFGAQALGCVDVSVTPRLKVFGEFRFEVRSFGDPGGSMYRILGGLRVPLV
jgi:hypothetical protein